MKKIAIFGAGGFGREVQMLIEKINTVNKEFEIIGFFDEGVQIGSLVNGLPVIGGIKELNDFNDYIYIAIAIGNPLTKKKIIESITNINVQFPTLIHPNVEVGNFVEIGKGSIICAGCIITVNIVIKDFVILNLVCTVGHDSIIGNYSSFMPGINISGEVEIEDCVYIGTGAKIINQLSIGENTIVGAGAVVSKTLPANCTAVGIPAKPIKFH